jgi:hypothetical protein
MMSLSEKSSYRGSWRAFLAVFGSIVVIGFICELIDRSRSNFEKAEGFIADLQTIAAGIPRSLDGTILRQGALSTAWIDDAGALPTRLQAMAGTLKGAEDQRTLGLVRRWPWSSTLPLETKDTLLWTTLYTVPKPVCQQLAAAVAKHPDQVAYISSSGNPAVIPAVLDPNAMCRHKFNSFAIVALDPATEVRRLSADVRDAIQTIPAEKAAISGSSAPFQVNRGQEGGPGFIQTDQSRVKVTINNVPLAVCRLALMMGPRTFGMDAFEISDGKAASSPPTGSPPEALCKALKGRLVMTRSRAPAGTD